MTATAGGAKLEEHISAICFLLDSAPRNWIGQQEIHLRLCRVLKKRGIRVVLVYAEGVSPDVVRKLQEAGAEIEILGYGKRRYRYYKELGRIFKKYSISMVHVAYFDYFSLIPWFARLHGVKHIIYEELNSGMMTATSWKRSLLRLRTSLMSLPMKRVIAVSEFIKQDLINRGIREDDIVVRYLAADELKFKPDSEARELWAASHGISPNELVMSSVTLLRPFKSPETLVEACSVLAQRGVKAHLFVAGDGAMLDSLKELSQRLGVEDRIHWLGFCSDPTSLIQASDVFLLASVAEAGAFVLSEAMGCGVPIVGSRSGVIGEFVEEGQTGFLATPKDPSAFADAIERLARDESLRSTMRKNSRERMLQRFTIDIHVANTIEIYESMFTG